ncbi:PWWP domain-containing protein 2A-like [Anneissia japonica]|uniref:PWWP domain-containing protein 2A-like n=1 Tax=Anneissia japonica TaxID=1529436 RepID=UPI0014258933|nr:PWWP domain-containing protein 2A-like [Anneissia japonica]XP_033109731.1 PWWP domain-containing protein 2A-like [Anneissia japonica]
MRAVAFCERSVEANLGKMATEDSKQAPQKGTVYLVEVEESLNDVLVVCLRHGDRVFRGVLIDALKSGPIGVTPAMMPVTNNTATQLDEDKSMTSVMETTVPQATEGHSTLGYRQTYYQNLPLSPPRPLLLSGRTNCSYPKQRMSTRTRPFRLRPRHLLCSRCKHSLKDNPSSVKLEKPIKRKHENECPTNKKKKTDSIETHTICHEKQVIKISYAAPKKEGTDIFAKLPKITQSVASSKQQNKLDRAKKVLQKAKTKVQKKNTRPTIKYKPKHNVNGCSVKSSKNNSKVAKQNGLIKEVVTKNSSQQQNFSTQLPVQTPNGRSKTKKPNENRTQQPTATKKKGNITTNSKANLNVNDDNQKLIGENIDVYDFDSDDSESDVEEIEINPGKTAEGEKLSRIKVNVHKKNITRVVLDDGRIMCIGDVIWGKIVGFPWWPGRVVRMNVSRQDNGTVVNQEALIKWFAANTISYINVEKLFPFLQYYNSRYNRKKRGVYKEAVKMANVEALALSPEVRALNTMFETSALQP